MQDELEPSKAAGSLKVLRSYAESRLGVRLANDFLRVRGDTVSGLG